MSKGTYDVQKGQVPEGRPARGDSSYRSFLCAILIFLVLCVIIILVGNWNSISGRNEKKQKNNNIEEFLEFGQNEDAEFVQKASTESQLHATKSNYVQSNENNSKLERYTTRKVMTRPPLTSTKRPIHYDDSKEEEEPEADYSSEEDDRKKTEASTSKIELIIVTKGTERSTTINGSETTMKVATTFKEKDNVVHDKTSTTVSDKVVAKDGELEVTTNAGEFDERNKGGKTTENVATENGVAKTTVVGKTTERVLTNATQNIVGATTANPSETTTKRSDLLSMIAEENRGNKTDRTESDIIVEAQTTDEYTTEAQTTEEYTTEAQTTEAETTEAETTEAQTTDAQTTDVRTTEVQTTEAQTTEAQTTEAQTTDVPTTEAETTEAQTTDAQTTDVPTTEVQTTEAPTTEAQTTEAQTTEAETTEAQTTEAQTTDAPTTEAQTTEAETTDAPTTDAQTTEAPTTEAQTTEGQTTEAETTEAPTTDAQTTEAQTTEAETTEAETTEAPTTEAQTTEAETTEAETTEAPTTEAQTTEEYTTEASTTEAQTTEQYTTETQTTESFVEQNATESAINRQLTTEKGNLPQEGTTCRSRGCKAVASNMLTLMDDGADACEDFYTFSCGNKKHRQPDDKSDTAGIWEALFNQTVLINNSSPSHYRIFRRFYDKCVNFHYTYSYEERIETVKAVLKSYGMESFQAAKVCDIDNIFHKLISLKSMYFMEVGLGDEQGILQLGPSLESSGEIGPWSALAANQRRCLDEQRRKIYGGGNLNLGGVHEAHEECLEDHKEFRQLLHDAIKAFGYDKNEAVNQHFTINYINKLLSIMPNRTAINEAKLNRDYVNMTVGQLQSDFPKVNWTNIFEIVQSTPIGQNQTVQVYFKEYFVNWFQIFNNINQKKWLLINLLITDLYYNLVVHKVNDDVQNHCLKTASTHLGDIASNLFLKNFPEHFVEEHEKRLHDVYRVLKSKMHVALAGSPEFSGLAGSLDSLRLVFSNGMWTVADSALSARYADFGTYPSYQEYLLRAKVYGLNAKHDVLKFGGKFKPFDTNPVTYTYYNRIFVPLGMVLNIPFDLPKHVTFARIGIKLAQAIASAFEPYHLKRQYSESESYRTFIENANSFIDYIQRTFDGFSATVNANLTLNERIRDTIALRLLTDAYSGHNDDSTLPWISSAYNSEKVMLVAVAQEFCDDRNPLDYMVKLYEKGQLPGIAKVHNMFMMSERFVQVFDCADGSRMNENPMKSQFPYLDTEYRMEDNLNAN